MLTVLTQKPLFSKGKPSDAHHLRHVQPRALGPGDERAWWQTAGVDPLKAARKLWTHTRVNEGRIRLERTSRAIDSDILSAMDGKAPELHVL